MSKSEQNLRDAFAGESQANRKYLAFAKKADQEGYGQVAKLFRAAAEAETVHAHAHLRTLKGIGATADNLKEAIAGETHEFKAMYPQNIDFVNSTAAARANGYIGGHGKPEEIAANMENLGLSISGQKRLLERSNNWRN